MSLKILAVDPGTHESGWAIYNNGKILLSGISNNNEMKTICRETECDLFAIEMIQAMGMPVGREVFETCVWIGRFIENCSSPHKFIYRKDVKMHLCKSMKAKDGNIRQAIIDKLGVQGTKANPGPTYGIRSHIWSAVGIAITASETN